MDDTVKQYTWKKWLYEEFPKKAKEQNIAENERRLMALAALYLDINEKHFRSLIKEESIPQKRYWAPFKKKTNGHIDYAKRVFLK